jgi:hypothetical protein
MNPTPDDILCRAHELATECEEYIKAAKAELRGMSEEQLTRVIEAWYFMKLAELDLRHECKCQAKPTITSDGIKWDA